ncbi:DUF6086 family protein [Streptomyces sp. st115]|uniref:DUF6086 family protein n=1 Tax=Streptomyces sp. st115 TaxID=1828047 RepID=UPI00211D7505|nr:DUF6086 family protein [Streptomyces sp. st115]
MSPETFKTFVDATRHRRTSHAIWLALSEGFIVTTLVLAETSGGRGGLGLSRVHCGSLVRDVQVSAVRHANSGRTRGLGRGPA